MKVKVWAWSCFLSAATVFLSGAILHLSVSLIVWTWPTLAALGFIARVSVVAGILIGTAFMCSEEAKVVIKERENDSYR